jgi:hypothetical protein
MRAISEGLLPARLEDCAIFDWSSAMFWGIDIQKHSPERAQRFTEGASLYELSVLVVEIT